MQVEIKCPTRRQITHEVPPHYFAQVQCQLEVCNAEACVFAQYKQSTCFARGELDIILVQRDRVWFADQLARFLQPFWDRVTAFYDAKGKHVGDLIEDLEDSRVKKRAKEGRTV